MIDFNEAVLRTFENVSQEDGHFFYPLKTKKQVRDFTKAIIKLGLELKQLCKEVNAAPHDFEIWVSKRGKSWIGGRLMEKINSYIGSVLICVDTPTSKKLQEAEVMLKNGKGFNEVNNKNINLEAGRVKEFMDKSLFFKAPFQVISAEKPLETKRSDISLRDDCIINATSTFCNSSMPNTGTDLILMQQDRKETKSATRVQGLIDKFNKLGELSYMKRERLGSFQENPHGVAKNSLVRKDFHLVKGKMPVERHDKVGADGSILGVGSGDEMKLDVKYKDNVFSNVSFCSRLQEDQIRSSDMISKKFFSKLNGEGNIPINGPNLKMSRNLKKQIYVQKDPENIGYLDYPPLKDKENITATWDATSSKVVERSATKQKIITFNKYCAQKELKDSTNFQIKANISKRFGHNVSQIISKFNKL